MITADELRKIMPQSKSLADVFVKPLNDAMSQYGINSFSRECAFLAQIAHESGQLHFEREIWGPTPAQLGYEGREDLGNTQPGDGKKFKGRGLIQITGRANYHACGLEIGFPLEEHPELLETAAVAAKSAAWFWEKHGLNKLADSGDFIRITRRINGGLNGLEERQKFYEAAKAVLA